MHPELHIAAGSRWLVSTTTKVRLSTAAWRPSANAKRSLAAHRCKIVSSPTSAIAVGSHHIRCRREWSGGVESCHCFLMFGSHPGKLSKFVVRLRLSQIFHKSMATAVQPIIRSIFFIGLCLPTSVANIMCYRCQSARGKRPRPQR